MNNITNFKLLKEVWTTVDEKNKLIFFLFLSLTNALIEAINIGLLIPFIKIFESPEILNEYFFYKIFIDLVTISVDPRIFILLSFVFFLLASVSFRIYINWFTLRISYSISEKLASKIYKEVLNRNFLDHVKENTSKSITDVRFRVDATTTVLMSTIIIINNTILSFLILGTLLFIEFKIIGIVVAMIGIFYIITSLLLRSKINQNSKIISKNQTSLIKTLQEGLGGIKEIILTSSQPIFVKEFNKSFTRLNSSLIFNNFFAQSPKFIIETLVILLFLLFYYYWFIQGKSIIELSALIGVLVFGAQKLLPSFQAIFQNWTNITSNKYLVLEIINILKNKKRNQNFQKKISIKKEISLKINSFGYKKEEILKNIELKINKGQKIGILGPSGSGKSTLINILVGLISEYDGILKVDGVLIDESNIISWRNKIAYVPQNVFLFDASLKSNITFGNKRDSDIGEILTKVKLNSFIGDRDINEIEVGERSSKISGGEKQRIALARALYKNASIIVFDEATNALDKETEAEIFKIIYQLKNVTILVITHEVENLNGCDEVYELNNRNLKRIKID